MKTYDLKFQDGSEPESHEIQTALFLSKHGKKITFLAPKNQPNVKTPDISMDGEKWEMKAPNNSGARTIEHAVRSASKQSNSIIIDLHRSPIGTNRALSQIKFHALRRTSIKKLIVITKENTLLDIK